MIINAEQNTPNHVEFVSYTGKWPNLCSGILTLKIDGEEYRFGHDYRVWESWKTDGNFQSFWLSGGGLNPNYEGAYQNPWRIDFKLLPDQFKKYVKEIDKVFNANVRHGCCGGCI